MEELIKVSYDKETPTVSGRELHQFLEVKSRYNDWFRNMSEYGFEDGKDYLAFTKNLVSGGRETDHELTLPMAKELCMLQRNEKGKTARRYFLKIEEAWNSPDMVMSRALKMADTTIRELSVKIEQLIPKAQFFDAVAESKSAIQMADVAKVLEHKGIGRNNLFEILRNKGILQSDNRPYQQYIDRGYFRVIEQKYTTKDGDTRINIKTLVYQKGVDYINNLLNKL